MNQKNQKGITLIALVITIIVLLILAGVSINMVLGDDGIIKNAQAAKKANKEANIKEAIRLLALEKKAAQHMGEDITGYPNTAQEVIDYLIEKGIVEEGELTVSEDDYKSIEGVDNLSIDIGLEEYGIFSWETTELFDVDANGVLIWADEDIESRLLDGDYYGAEVVYDGDVYIPEGTTTIRDQWLTNLTANDIYLPDSLKIIGNFALEGITANNIYIPNTVTSINWYGLAGVTANEIYIPNSVTSIGEGAFNGATIESIYLPSSITSTSDYVFQYASISSITLACRELGYDMFFGCQKLSSITLEEGITSIIRSFS